MRHLFALTAAAALAVSLLISSATPAQAHHRDRVAIGLAAAIVGGAIASHRYHKRHHYVGYRGFRHRGFRRHRGYRYRSFRRHRGFRRYGFRSHRGFRHGRFYRSGRSYRGGRFYRNRAYRNYLDRGGRASSPEAGNR
ncbi:MAG: hypothetical protein OXR62_06295 [Ahrensia sp.]|nr:hypothetical protein [Ahrensia sp.]